MKTSAYILGTFTLIGTLQLPIGYYTFLRILVTAGALWILYNINDNKIEGWDYFLIITAIFFNPVFPVYLNKEMWSVIDVVTGIGYLLFGFKFHDYFNKNR